MESGFGFAVHRSRLQLSRVVGKIDIVGHFVEP